MKKGRFSATLSLLLSLSQSILFGEEISSPRERLRRISEMIIQEKKMLFEAREREKEVLKGLNLLNKEIRKREESLKRLGEELSKIEEECRRIEDEILLCKMELERRRGILSKRLLAMYRFRRLGYLEAILTASDFADFTKRTHFIGLIARQDANLIKLTKENLEKIEAMKRDLLAKKEEIEELKKKEEKVKAIYEIQKGSRKRLLADIRKSKARYLSRIKELERASRDIRRLIKQFESKKAGVEKEKVPRGLSPRILGLKNRLPWPVNGEVVRGFGPYTHPRFNTQADNKGIDIRAPYGEIVSSVLEGVVVFADHFKGYGRLAMIDHGGGLYSLYAYLSDIFVKKGDFVNTGSKIGRVGEGEEPGKGCLHFELRINGEPIDPIQWLRRR